MRRSDRPLWGSDPPSFSLIQQSAWKVNSPKLKRVGERRLFVGVSRCIYNVPKGPIGKDRSDVGGDGRKVGPHSGAA